MNFLKIKKRLWPTFYSDGTLLLDYYVRILFLLYPLLGIGNKERNIFFTNVGLYLMLTVITLVLYFYVVYNDIKKLDGKREKIVCAVLLIFLAVRILISLGGQDEKLVGDLFIICLAAAFFLTGNVTEKYEYYLNLLLFSSFFISSILWTEIWRERGRSQMVSMEYSLLLLLLISISAAMFCIEKRKDKKILFFFLFLVGLFPLLLTGNILEKSMVWFTLLCIPVIFMPTVPLIRGNLYLCITFLSLISNLPLLMLFGDLEGIQSVHIQGSVWIDIFLACAGFAIFQYWKKIPISINPEYIVMKKVRRIYVGLLKITGSLLILAVLSGEKLVEMQRTTELSMIKNFSEQLRLILVRNKNFADIVLGRIGLLGILLLLSLVFMITNRLYRQSKRIGEKEKILLIPVFIFLVSLFLLKPQVNSVPLFVILMVFALKAGKDEGKKGAI